MTPSEIKNLVIQKLEEYSPFGPPTDSNPLLAAGTGENVTQIKPVFSYAWTALPEAADEMLLMIPMHKFGTMRTSSDPEAPMPVIIEADALSGERVEQDIDLHTTAVKIIAPDNFLRLIEMKFSSWVRPVYETVKPSDPDHKLQYSIWTRGHKEKPVVTYDGTYLKAYTIPYNGETDTQHVINTDDGDFYLYYIQHFDDTLNMNYPVEVAELIALNCAKKVLEEYGNKEQVVLLDNEIKQIFSTVMVL